MSKKENEVNDYNEKFYEELTKLMSKAYDLQNYLKRKEGEQKDKVKKRKINDFFDQLIIFGKINTNSNEQLTFRLYNIIYLNKLISEYKYYCSDKDIKLVELIVDKINKKENFNDNEIKKNSDSNFDDNKICDLNKINLKETILLNDESNILIKKSLNNSLVNNINEKNDNNINKEYNDFEDINKNKINDNQLKKSYFNEDDIQNKVSNENEKKKIIDDEFLDYTNNLRNNDNICEDEDDDEEYNENNNGVNNQNNDVNIINKTNFNDDFKYNNKEKNINFNNGKINEEENKKQILINDKILEKTYEDSSTNFTGMTTDISNGEKTINKNKKYLAQKNYKNHNNNNFGLKPASKIEKKINNLYNSIFESSSHNILSLIKDKFLNEKGWLNTTTSIIDSIIDGKDCENMNKKYLLQLIILSCIIYPFTSINHKLKLSEIKSKNKSIANLMEYLNKNLLYKLNDDLKNSKNISKAIDLFQNFTKTKKAKEKLKEHISNLKLKPNEEGKVILFELYKYLIINRIFIFDNNHNNKYQLKKSFNDVNTEEDLYFLAFKIHFILYYQQFYSAISNDIIEVYEGLFLIKKFYTEIFCENKINKNILETNVDEKNENCFLFGKDKIPLTMNKNITFELDLLFEEEDNEIFNDVMSKIKHFYHFDENNINELLDYSTMKVGGNKKYNFIIDLVNLHLNKNIYISQNFDEYKNNLIKIENEIYKYSAILNNKDNNNLIIKYSIEKYKKYVFNSLQNLLAENLEKKYINRYNLYPFGSITEFLSGENSDMDIYLDCSEQNVNERISFINNVRSILLSIDNKINHQYFPTISTRICVMSFTYKNTSIDLSIMGFCPYIHSLLVREYSLIDPRFPMLTITLKKFIELLGLKNNQEYLNSYSWICLLIAFLQDIISPPILPKLFSYDEKSTINKIVEFGNNIKKGNNFFNKTVDSFIYNIKKENILLPDCIFNRNKIKEIYDEKIGKNKNTLSCAEIFLSFLEFVIFYFKKDSTFVNCSLENEGYESMSNIINLHDNDEFEGYFCNKYLKVKDYNTKKKTKDGLILIRDPVDPHYNPGQSLRQGNFEKFIEKIKEGYYVLLEKGSFKCLNSK